MNDRGILTTRSEVVEHFGETYHFPKKEAVVYARLDFRAWGKKNSLGCYFSSLEDDSKLLLYAWIKRNGINNEYRPSQSTIDFATVKDGTEWKVTIDKNSKGNYTWIMAEPIE